MNDGHKAAYFYPEDKEYILQVFRAPALLSFAKIADGFETLINIDEYRLRSGVEQFFGLVEGKLHDVAEKNRCITIPMNKLHLSNIERSYFSEVLMKKAKNITSNYNYGQVDDIQLTITSQKPYWEVAQLKKDVLHYLGYEDNSLGKFTGIIKKERELPLEYEQFFNIFYGQLQYIYEKAQRPKKETVSDKIFIPLNEFSVAENISTLLQKAQKKLKIEGMSIEYDPKEKTLTCIFENTPVAQVEPKGELQGIVASLLQKSKSVCNIF